MPHHAEDANNSWVTPENEPLLRPNADVEDPRAPVWDFTDTLRISVAGETGLCLEDISRDDIATSVRLLVDQADRFLPQEDDTGTIVVGISPEHGQFEVIEEIDFEGTTIGDIVTLIAQKLLDDDHADPEDEVCIYGLARGENANRCKVYFPDLEGE